MKNKNTDWEKEFDKFSEILKFEDGVERLAWKVNPVVVKNFIQSEKDLSYQQGREDVRKEILEGMPGKIELTPAITLNDHWGLTEGSLDRQVNNIDAYGFNRCLFQVEKVIKEIK